MWREVMKGDDEGEVPTLGARVVDALRYAVGMSPSVGAAGAGAPRREVKRHRGVVAAAAAAGTRGGGEGEGTEEGGDPLVVRVVYASGRGKARGLAARLAQAVREDAGSNATAVAVDLSDVDPERDAPLGECCVLVCSHYEGGGPPPGDGYSWFFRWLRESSCDERIDRAPGRNLGRFAVLGLGDSVYGGGDFCRLARDADGWLADLGGQRMLLPAFADEQGDVEETVARFTAELLVAVRRVAANAPLRVVDSKRRRVLKGGGAERKDEEDEVEEDDDDDADNEGGGGEARRTASDDIEDMAGVGAAASGADAGGKRKMVTPLMGKALAKQGYSIVGSHSGVKLCRWTKAMMRGRGGCYKHTFYGIDSHRCMEATPSLACSSKCTFCWRAHTNPVGRSWTWAMEPADEVVQGMLKGHLGMIKACRGIPGVRPERFAEAFRVRHCALSLVGEPIMYPEINRLLDLLHENRISTYLVTNAQHPDAFRALGRVTQLYCSIDASNKEDLKAIDRPLFSDYWERFHACLSELDRRRHELRTVFRLTLVKGMNDAEVAEYAQLVRRYRPGFVEVKGMTFTGGNGSDSMTIKNCPTHAEVADFCVRLCAAIDDDTTEETKGRDAASYGLASEHEHSCCVCVARRDQYWVDGSWHTWIDYDRFADLVAREKATGEGFTVADFRAPTPAWATYGVSETRGFDPGEERVRTKGKAAKAALRALPEGQTPPGFVANAVGGRVAASDLPPLPTRGTGSL